MYTDSPHKPDLPGAVLVPLGLISDQLGLHKAFDWFQEHRLRHAMMRQLHRLNDDCLDDIGIKRKDIRPIVNALMECVRKERSGSRRHPIFTLASMAAAGALPGWPLPAAREREARRDVRQ